MLLRALLFCTLVCGQAWSQNQPSQLALQALDDLKFIIDETNYEDLGFRSLAELEKMVLGDALPVHFVGLGQIQDYKRASVDDLYGSVQELVFPVLADGHVRTSVVVKHDGQNWEVAGFGRKRMTNALATTEKIRSQDEERITKDYFAIEVPSLFLLFICHKLGEQTMVTYIREETAQPGQASKPRSLTVEDQLRQDIFSEFEQETRPFDADLLERIRFLAEVAQDPLASQPADE